MRAALLNIGTELLMGYTVNTNATYMASQLTEIGVGVYEQVSIGDNPNRLKETFKRLYEAYDVIITTGGLGPTQDDLTKETIADALDLSMHESPQVKEDLIAFFESYQVEMTDNNLRQAQFPRGSFILKNPHGTAPGCYLKRDDKHVFILPGPPREMIPMMEDHVIPRLAKLQDGLFKSVYITCVGIGESSAEDKILDLIMTQSNPTIATYAGDGHITFRVTANGGDKGEVEGLLEPVVDAIRDRLSDYVISLEGKKIHQVLADALMEKKWSLATAESCTGGKIAERLVSVSGVSSVYKAGFVTYSNEAKMKQLGVSDVSLSSVGAVSEEVAVEMLMGLKRETDAFVGISTTGIAGPTGGSPTKPVGLVYIGTRVGDDIRITRHEFKGNRERVRERSTISALNQCLRHMKEYKSITNA